MHGGDMRKPPTITQYTFLVGNGTLLPLYLECREAFEDNFKYEDCRVEYLPKTKNKKERRGEEGTIAALEYQKKLSSFSVGDVLISDNERAFDTELVRELLNDMGVLKLNFPIGLGHLLDPCDNEMHSEQKTRYISISIVNSIFFCSPSC
jgi:hypothetical protein